MAVLALGVIYFLATLNLRSLGLPIGAWPRVPLYVYTTSTVTLTFDGQEIAIEGTTRCRRRIEMDEDGDLRPLVFLDHVGFAYYCGPQWFGHRFEDGSALLVGAYSNSSDWRRALSDFLGGAPIQPHFDGDALSIQFSRLPPAVIWLDNAEAPTRAEYYYSMAALEDPRARLTAIQHDAVTWPASLWTSLFTGRAPSNLSDQVPWSIPGRLSSLLVGYYIVELPRERWETIQGLREQLTRLSDPTLIYPGAFLSKDQRIALSGTLAGLPGRFPPRKVQVYASIGRHDALGTPLPAGPEAVPPELEVSVWPLKADGDSFRIDEDTPPGAVRLYRRQQESQPGSDKLRLGDDELVARNSDLWLSGFLYVPASDTIYRSSRVSF